VTALVCIVVQSALWNLNWLKSADRQTMFDREANKAIMGKQLLSPCLPACPSVCLYVCMYVHVVSYRSVVHDS